MNESMGIIAVLAVIGLLAAVAVYRFAAQRRQLASGRSIGRVLPELRDREMIFETRVPVSTGGKWCRLLLTLKSRESHRICYSPRYFFKKTALVVGTPYTLTITDAKGRVVHKEKGSLGPFVTWLWSRDHTRETMMEERSAGSHWGTVTLLEFLPRDAGTYGLSLQITRKSEADSPGSSSMWEVLDAELAIREDVIPLSGTVSYPHQRVRI